jgi:hypothetical protein
MSNRTYDILKWISLVVLPAAATLYGVLSKIWGLPYGSEIVATITAIDVFLGTLLGVSSIQYSKKGNK